MPDQLPPPPLTMVDPSRPGVAVDVVSAGDERDPWRPGRRTWALVAVLVLAAAVALPVRAHQRSVDRLHALDRAAAAAVSLAPTADPRINDNGDTSPGTVGIGLRNDSDRPVTLLGFRVLGPGYLPEKTDLTLRGNDLVGLDVKDTATCAKGLLDPTSSAEQIRLTVRTARGQVVTKDEPLIDTAGNALRQRAQERCRLLSSDGALFQQIVDVGAVSHRTLRATINLRNGGRLPLTVDRVEGYPGTTVTSSPATPLALPFSPDLNGIGGTDVTVTVTIGSCGRVLGTPLPFVDRNLDVDGPGSVVLHATGATGPVEIVVSLESSPGDFLGAACPVQQP